MNPGPLAVTFLSPCLDIRYHRHALNFVLEPVPEPDLEGEVETLVPTIRSISSASASSAFKCTTIPVPAGRSSPLYPHCIFALTLTHNVMLRPRNCRFFFKKKNLSTHGCHWGSGISEHRRSSKVWRPRRCTTKRKHLSRNRNAPVEMACRVGPDANAQRSCVGFGNCRLCRHHSRAVGWLGFRVPGSGLRVDTAQAPLNVHARMNGLSIADTAHELSNGVPRFWRVR